MAAIAREWWQEGATYELRTTAGLYWGKFLGTYSDPICEADGGYYVLLQTGPENAIRMGRGIWSPNIQSARPLGAG